MQRKTSLKLLFIGVGLAVLGAFLALVASLTLVGFITTAIGVALISLVAFRIV
ncbi:MAG TPA: hypothetical protein PLJ04_00490 [Candidatus Saccharibacteria bacterium]|nr:hypothetical protein [Candidatus Saccharibacteria bacterium]HPR10039.1 hypothetical protein [Candidatus Saccharibacteria bacterium]